LRARLFLFLLCLLERSRQSPHADAGAVGGKVLQPLDLVFPQVRDNNEPHKGIRNLILRSAVQRRSDSGKIAL